VFSDLGVYGLGVVTCVTAQNSRGVDKIFKVAPRIVTAQIDSLTSDFEITACKLGMLYSPQTVDKVRDRITRRELHNIVLDPVMQAKGGEVLLTPVAIKRLKKRLLPVVDIVTPNADEAEALCGIAVTDVASAKEAAKAIHALGSKYVLVKGGHIQGEPVDVLYDGNSFIEYATKRLDKNMHGTGCVFSAAIAARLALGDEVPVAILFAKEYVSKAIEKCITLGKGNMQFFRTGS
jgi:hydroxymethylpyrimidine kinase/phosphomethylpyrimidine kinase